MQQGFDGVGHVLRHGVGVPEQPGFPTVHRGHEGARTDQGLHGQPGDIRQRQGMGQRPFPVGPGGHHQVSPGNDQHRIFHTAVRRQVGLAGEEEIGHILAYGQAIPDQAVQLSRYLV